MSDASQGAHRTQGRVGSVFGGRWKVDARIGAGGMATVYEVSDPRGNRAALKMLHAQLSRDPQTRARFVREGKVANSVAHPGVVRVLDDGVSDDGNAYLVLELLEGETIEARRLRLGGSLPLEEVLDTADMALDALAAAHAKQIIHRDVKPENFFLCFDGSVKLLDFGLARMKDEGAEATRTGVTIGTPEFMPPEQALGRRDSIDARSDVWGLGATMFNAITGQYVHDAPTLHEQLMASATKRARPIRTLAPFVPAAVAAVIDRALELDMNDRWQSAQDMQDALREARLGRGPAQRHDDLPSGDGESLTFPITSKSPGTVQLKAPISRPNIPISVPSSSAKTVQIDPHPSPAPHDQMAFGETTLALDPMSKLPVSPIPSTERMNPEHMTPGALPNAPNVNAFGMQGMHGTLPAFTPSSVRAVPQMPPASVPGYGMQRDAPPPPPLHAAPTLRSSSRGILIGVIVFAASVIIGGWFAWYYLFAR